ncbi:RibD C-terminal domain-containing protein [Nocardiopsis flavescens]|uniref:RibD C-terminal domain-containing protein n=1 Tax=Nocardiopsis flavescens TaxID=758803 RepID=A0A1M6B507_9ACTN|nr:dihydrofolate reductase family protein [Nocardiopsis flavescens]SHI43832.1 RibD C-terminal domain-containing protein [Nocardiopsis flavescens]
MSEHTGRRVVANLNLTLDGRYCGPAGPQDHAWVVPYAVTDLARDHLTDLWRTATTALMGRVNAEGFLGYWPPVARDEGADPRDRGFGDWLARTEKVVLSRTLTASPWEGVRVENAPAAAVVDALRAREGGDILVPCSASLIRPLLAADRVDRLALMVVPEFVGGGPRLFEDGLPAHRWSLASHAAGGDGALALVYDRLR